MTQTLDALLAAPSAAADGGASHVDETASAELNTSAELLTSNVDARKPDQYAEIPVSVMHAGDNPRTLFDDEALEVLAASIREHGVLEPLIVRAAPPASPLVETGYAIVAGERRFRAAQLAGLTHVPCLIRDVRTDRDAQALALIENLHRVDLNCMETAAGYRRLGDLGYDQARIAALIHRSPSVVSNTMRLLKLPEKVQAMLRDGRLSESHGLALLPCLGFVGEAEMLALQAADDGLSVSALRAEVTRRHPKSAEAPAPALPLDVPDAPSGAANKNTIFAAPHPEPLTPQGDNAPPKNSENDGDLSDEEWEASARPTSLDPAPAAPGEVREGYAYPVGFRFYRGVGGRGPIVITGFTNELDGAPGYQINFLDHNNNLIVTGRMREADIRRELELAREVRENAQAKPSHTTPQEAPNDSQAEVQPQAGDGHVPPAPDAQAGDESDGAGEGEGRQDVPAGDAGLPDVPPAVTPDAPGDGGPGDAVAAPAAAEAAAQPDAPAPVAPGDFRQAYAALLGELRAVLKTFHGCHFSITRPYVCGLVGGVVDGYGPGGPHWPGEAFRAGDRVEAAMIYGGWRPGTVARIEDLEGRPAARVRLDVSDRYAKFTRPTLCLLENLRPLTEAAAETDTPAETNDAAGIPDSTPSIPDSDGAAPEPSLNHTLAIPKVEVVAAIEGLGTPTLKDGDRVTHRIKPALGPGRIDGIQMIGDLPLARVRFDNSHEECAALSSLEPADGNADAEPEAYAPRELDFCKSCGVIPVSEGETFCPDCDPAEVSR